jgi:hypothetical protein
MQTNVEANYETDERVYEMDLDIDTDADEDEEISDGESLLEDQDHPPEYYLSHAKRSTIPIL